MDDQQLRDEVDPIMTPWLKNSMRRVRPGRLENLPIQPHPITEED